MVVHQGKSSKRSIGIIVLGVGKESENASRRLARRLKDHPRVGAEKCRAHRIRCGGPADFNGDERDVVLAILPSRVLLNNINLVRWNQAVNVTMSRARERFHLFHQLRPADIKCCEDDPRRRLVEYCNRATHGGGSAGCRAAWDLEGFARDVREDLSGAGIEVRDCDEILSADWRNKVLVVEGGERLVAVVLCGYEGQTADLWRAEAFKWTALSRVDWRVVEIWRFQRALDPPGFVNTLLRTLFEEGVKLSDALEPPGSGSDAQLPYDDHIQVLAFSYALCYLNADFLHLCTTFYPWLDSWPVSSTSNLSEAN